MREVEAGGCSHAHDHMNNFNTFLDCRGKRHRSIEWNWKMNWGGRGRPQTLPHQSDFTTIG